MVCSRPLGSVSWTRSPTVSSPRRRAGPSGTSAGAASEEGGGVTVEESTKSSGERGAPGRTRPGGLLCEAPAAALARLGGLDLAVLRRRRGDQRGEELGGGRRDGVDGPVEGLLVRLRRA